MISYYSIGEVCEILGKKTNATVYRIVNKNYIADSIIREGRNYIISEDWINYYQQKLLLENATKIVFGVYGYSFAKPLLFNFFRLLRSRDNDFTITFKNINIEVSLIRDKKIVTDFNIKITNLIHCEFPQVSEIFKEMLLERLILETNIKMTTVTSFEIENAKFIMPPKTRTYQFSDCVNFKATIKYMGILYTMNTVKELRAFLKQDFPYTE